MIPAREKFGAIAWGKSTGDLRGFDRGMLAVVEALIDEVESLQAQIRHIGYVQEGGGPE